MKATEFNEIAEARIDHCRNTLIIKGEEYSRDNDRLHNFKTAAAIDGDTPEQALWGMLRKHIVSVRDMVADIERIIDDPTWESPFMFTNSRGRTADKRYTEKVLNRLWSEACAVVGESIEMYSGLKHSSMSQYTNEKHMGMAELQIISGHKNIASVYKYADVALARKRELMEALSVVENKKVMNVK